jgi:type IV pilus assembly protein PilA
VLVAIGVPVYLNYRKRAADKSAQSAVSAAVSAVEQFYGSNGNTLPDTDKSPNGAAITLTAAALKAAAGTLSLDTCA